MILSTMINFYDQVSTLKYKPDDTVQYKWSVTLYSALYFT